MSSAAGCGGGDTMRTDWWLAAQQVVVHAYVEHREGDCTDDYSTHEETVELDAPLGDRRLLGCAAPADGLRAPDRRPDPRRCAGPLDP